MTVGDSAVVTSVFRYILSQTLLPLGFSVVVLTAIVWLTQSLQRVELLVEHGESFGAFLLITLLMLPSLLAIVVPIAFFAAVLYALSKLHSDSELVVLFAAGCGRWRIAAPVLALAAFCAALTLAINVWMMPAGYRLMKQRIAEIRADIASGLVRSGEFTTPIEGITFYAQEALSGGRYRFLLIEDSRNPDRPSAYMAERGVFRKDQNAPQLVLADGNYQTYDPEKGEVTFVNFDQTSLDMSQFVKPTGELQLELTERYLHELFFPDLSNSWAAQNRGRLLSEGHSRLATPLYNFAFAMIALAALLTGGYSRRGYGWRITIAVGAAFGARLCGVVVQSVSADVSIFMPFHYVAPIAAILAAAYPLFGQPDIGGRRARPVLAAGAA